MLQFNVTCAKEPLRPAIRRLRWVYPAQPNHTEKRTLFQLLDAEQATGITLTETYAMHPAASVSGLYFAHPAARYFAVNHLTGDQIESYAARKGMSVQEVERWLAPYLAYESS